MQKNVLNTDLTGKVAVVTGAASGIGAQAAVRLAGEGARVFLVDVNREGLEETKARIEAAGGEAEGCVCDVADENAVDAAVGQALARFGRIDVLVNVAGVQVTKLLVDTTKAEYDRMMDINSYSRPQFQNKSAYDMFVFFYGEDAARALGISRIPVKDINLTPSCLKPTES